jgi:hypothetical protein
MVDLQSFQLFPATEPAQATVALPLKQITLPYYSLVVPPQAYGSRREPREDIEAFLPVMLRVGGLKFCEALVWGSLFVQGLKDEYSMVEI